MGDPHLPEQAVMPPPEHRSISVFRACVRDISLFRANPAEAGI